MIKTSFQVKDGALWIAGTHIELPCEVGEILEAEGLVVVRLEPPIGQVFNRNIFAYSEQGLLLWQIEESPHGTEPDRPYVAISKDEAGGVVAANWNGIDYSVNLDNGYIKAKAFNK